MYGSTNKPKEIFGSGKDYEVFQDVMNDMLPEVWEANNIFLDIWNKNVDHYGWIMPDNFHVQVKVEDLIKESFRFKGYLFSVVKKVQKPTEKGRAYSANVVHSIDAYAVREITRACMYEPRKINAIKRILNGSSHYYCNSKNEEMINILLDRYKETGILSFRVLDYIDSNTINLVGKDKVQELINQLPEEPFELECIHDSFLCLPNHGNDVRRLYNYMLATVWNSHFLEYILRTLTGNENIKLNYNKTEYSKQILETEYALS